MNEIIYRFILLAEQGRLDHLTSGFRGRRARFDSDDLATGLLILGGVAVAIWVLSQFLARQEKNKPCNKPGRLFRNLCKAHGLGLADYWLLWRLARYHRLRDPARLFLEPERFDAANLNVAWRARAEQLREIGERLFADLATSEDRPADPTEPADLNPWNRAAAETPSQPAVPR